MTPRTDAQVCRLTKPLTGFASYPDTTEVVPAELARELERRLTTLGGIQTLCSEAARALRQIKDLANVNEHTRQMLVSIGNNLNEASRR
jgi:hypothetical protein